MKPCISRVETLPNWCVANGQPAFYDTESATAIQMTARLYKKMQELIEQYNEFTCEINNLIEEFEQGIIHDFCEFKHCVIDLMNKYIETIDTKINLQDLKIDEAIQRQDATIELAFTEQMQRILEKFAEQDQEIADEFREQNMNIADAINYMKNKIIDTTVNVVNQAINEGTIQVVLQYDEPEEHLHIDIITAQRVESEGSENE